MAVISWNPSAPTTPTTVCPVWIPMRACPSCSRASASSPALTARRALSSWATGYPKNASTPSPSNWDTWPPARSTGPTTAS